MKLSYLDSSHQTYPQTTVLIHTSRTMELMHILIMVRYPTTKVQCKNGTVILKMLLTTADSTPKLHQQSQKTNLPLP